MAAPRRGDRASGCIASRVKATTAGTPRATTSGRRKERERERKRVREREREERGRRRRAVPKDAGVPRTWTSTSRLDSESLSYPRRRNFPCATRTAASLRFAPHAPDRRPRLRSSVAAKPSRRVARCAASCRGRVASRHVTPRRASRRVASRARDIPGRRADREKRRPRESRGELN